MNNEESIPCFPIRAFVPVLVRCVTAEHVVQQEQKLEMMMNACRALANLLEALPRSIINLYDVIPVLVEKACHIENPSLSFSLLHSFNSIILTAYT